MLIPITLITTSVLTLIYFVLTMYVISLRTSGKGPSVGLEGSEVFVRAVRAHANFAEYTPLFLILLGMHEIYSPWTPLTVLLAAVFVCGRIAHGIGFGYLGRGPGRSVGMMATNTTLVVLALTNIALLLV